MPKELRIAMWSGPRNLSTALMRSFSSRDDTTVLDEPFYAYYLMETGIGHPGRDDVIAAYESDWHKVIANITGPIPDGKAIWFQKQMAHHMLPQIDIQRLVDSPALTHAFLIRDPADVITSYVKVHARMTLAETALPQQVDLFQRVCKRSGVPAVIDAKDVLVNPRRTLSTLCEKLGITFTDRMLSWAPGCHANDGNWAPHWYASVYQSTGFDEYRPKTEPTPAALKPMLAEARAIYDHLAAHKL
jgi:hypothetical protein